MRTRCFRWGGMTKPEVREVARRQGLALAEKPDSQEICFIPGGDYKQFLTAYLEEQGEADAGYRRRAGDRGRPRDRAPREHHRVHGGPAQGAEGVRRRRRST